MFRMDEQFVLLQQHPMVLYILGSAAAAILSFLTLARIIKLDLVKGGDKFFRGMSNEDMPLYIEAIVRHDRISSYEMMQELCKNTGGGGRYGYRVVPHWWGNTWKKVDIDIDYHLTKKELKDPNDDDELMDFLTEIQDHHFDINYPLWKMYFIPEYKGTSAMIVHIHHAMADGKQALEGLRMMDNVTTPNLMDMLPGYERIARMKIKESKLLRKIQLKIWAILNVAGVLVKLLKLKKVPKSPMSGSAKGVRKYGMAWEKDLDLIKRVAKFHKVTVNELVVSCTAGAFRKYIMEHTPEGEKPKTDFKAVISCPVDLHMPWDEALGNKIGFMWLRVPIWMEDPLERLSVCHRESNKAKRSVEPLVFQFLIGLVANLPFFLGNAIFNFFTSRAMALFSNVPGIAIQHKLGTSLMEDISFWLPVTGSINTSFSLLSYQNRCALGCISTTSDPKQLLGMWEEEFEELKNMM